jgi:hypothetical protein
MNLFDIFTIGSKIIDRVLPDPGQKMAAQQKLLEMQQAGELAQLNNELQMNLGQVEINKIEASSDNLFKSGWRPFIGWVCGAGLSYQFLFRPLLVGFVDKLFPDLDMGTLITLLAGMLGLGGMRTYEKLKGKA